MKVAIVHNFYRSDSPSGENVVVKAQAAALRRAGVDVELISHNSDSISDGRVARFALGAKVLAGFGRSPEDSLRRFKPDIVHVHNLFPGFSRRWFPSEFPVVGTMHNFRYACAAGTFFRDGVECLACVTRGSGRAVRHGCYRESVVASIPMAIGPSRGAKYDPLLNGADRLVALSDRARRLHEAAGVPAQKIRVVPNFVGRGAVSSSNNDAWVYVGRLSIEKGVRELVSHWPRTRALHVYGQGPLSRELREIAPPNVSFMGVVDHDVVTAQLPNYAGLVFPSLWAEGAIPLAYVEGLAAGLPVVAFKGNAASDHLESSRAGVTLDRWESIDEALRTVEGRRKEFAQRAMDAFEAEFSESSWVDKMSELYDEVVQEFRGSS